VGSGNVLRLGPSDPLAVGHLLGRNALVSLVRVEPRWPHVVRIAFVWRILRPVLELRHQHSTQRHARSLRATSGDIPEHWPRRTLRTIPTKAGPLQDLTSASRARPTTASTCLIC